MTPIVSMLWESVDPAERLQTRFGFPTTTAAADWVARVLDRYWGLRVDGCDRVVISGWNVMAWVRAGDRPFVAKWSALPLVFPRLVRSARVVQWLDGRGLPVAAPIPATDGRAMVQVPNTGRGWIRSRTPLPGGRFLLGVLPALGGDLLDVDVPSQVADAGRVLAELHDALAAYPAARAARRRGREGHQLVHNDFRSANVLHDGSRITGLLDFEDIKHDTRAADLAKAAVYLGTQYHDWGPVSDDVRRAFVDAYHERSPLTGGERDEVQRLIDDGLQERGWA